MTVNHVVVDGSNLATEGRTLPSLTQLDEAVRAYLSEFKPKTVTVVVDASFPNRIDESERALFEDAVLAGEVVSPPAGVIGRGDAFLLQIADRADAVVLSNDSFQEFHGQYAWLFDQGRLVGGKPVPHVGWVFMERSPVRGPLSRRSVSEAKKAAKEAATAASRPAATGGRKASKAAEKATGPSGGTGKKKAAGATKRTSKRLAPAPAHAAELATAHGDDGGRTRKRRGGGRSGGGGGAGAVPYNEALPFIEFVSAHPIGSTVEGEVERFASHGAYVMAEGARCYLPLKHLGDPPPRSAREVLSSGERYKFVVHGFDTPRRGVDLTMPGVVPITAGDLAAMGAASDPVPNQPKEERVAPAKKAAAKKTATKKRAAAKKAPAKKRAAAKKAPAKRKSTAKKASARKSTAKRAPARKAAKKSTKKAVRKTAKKATKKATKKAAKKKATKRATAKKAPARKAAKRSTKKAAKKATKRTAKRR